MAGRTAKGIARLGPGGALVWGGNVTGGSVRASPSPATGPWSMSAATSPRSVARSSAAGWRLDVHRGAATSFAVGTPNQPVNDIVVRSTGEVLIAGSFTSVGGTGRVRLAGLDGATGALGPISVGVNNTVNDLELDDAGNVVYLAGTFGTVGGSMRNRLAGVSLAGAGAVTPLALPGITGNLSAVTLDGNGGLFLGVLPDHAGEGQPGGDRPRRDRHQRRHQRGALLRDTAQPRPSCGERHQRSPGARAERRLLLVAGDFSDYGVTARSGLAAYDLTTGALRSDFNPAPDGQVNIVKASANAQSVFVGGEFLNIAGASRSRIAKLDIATGGNVPASPRPPTRTSRTWPCEPTAAPSTSAATSTPSTA